MEKEEKDEKEKGEPGLHLTDKTIHRISGPVSMYYLKPKTTKSLNRERTNLPLVLLWGDVHRDDSQMCADCSCSDEGCCYPIYDRAFLKELDKLASDYPVDFYTETSSDAPRITTMTNQKNILFHRFIYLTTYDCHRKIERSTPGYEAKCPTKNIRWHYSDPRFMENTVERYAFQLPVIIMEKYLNNLGFKKKMEQYLTIDPSHAKDCLTPEERETVFMMLSYYQANLVNHFHVEPHYIPKANSEKRPYYDEGRALFLKIVQLLLTRGSSIFVIRTYVDYITQNEKYSVVYKQIKKSGVAEFTPMYISYMLRIIMEKTNPRIQSFIKDIHYTCYAYPRVMAFFHDFFQPKLIDYNEKNENNAVYGCFTKKEVSLIFHVFRTLYELFFQLSSLMADLYSLFRMLKPPTGSSSPFLVMGYHGATHARNIATILQFSEFFDYELVYEKPFVNYNSSPVPPDYRCITIDKPIHLARDLEERAQAILQYPVHRNAYEKYQQVIEEERRGRRPASTYSPNDLFRLLVPSKGGKTYRVRGVRKARAKTKRLKRKRL